MRSGLVVGFSIALVLASAAAAEGSPKAHSNAEMTAIYDADQAVRKSGNVFTPAYWKRVGPEDAARRGRARQLLNGGVLHTADDFYHAAFVFQHGDTADDCLLGHALAMAALKLGRTDAGWIAAATLDRYLQRIGQKQVFGTQYGWKTGESWTMEPYNRNLIPASLRKVLGVPNVVEQEKELQNKYAGPRSD